jgi:hypothetical protein
VFSANALARDSSFGGSMLSGLVFAKGRLNAFPMGTDMALKTVPRATALVCGYYRYSLVPRVF